MVGVKSLSNQIKKIELPQLFQRGSIKSETYNEENQTMEVCFATGARGLRQSFWAGTFYEELSMDASAIRFDRLNNGAPVLDSHNSTELEAVIGVVENGYVDGGQAIAKIRFAKDEDSQKVVSKIRDGIISKLSVGYMVHKYERLVDAADGVPVYRAIDWEPMEVSFVSIPFDDQATVRNSNKITECTIIERGEEKMDEEVKDEVKAEEVLPVAEPVKEEVKDEVKQDVVAEPVAEEKKEVLAEEVKSEERSIEIIKLVSRAQLPAEFAEKLITRGASLEDARNEIITNLVERGSKVTIDNKLDIKAGELDEGMTRREAAMEAFLHRSNPMQFNLTEKGKNFRGLSTLEIGREFLEARGVKTRGMTKDALVSALLVRTGEHTTADFPSLLADVANKSLQKAYESAGQTFRPFVSVNTAPDFKNINRVQLGEGSTLELLPESGEVEYGTVTDSKEVYKLYSYARGLKISRQALINDDLSGFTTLPAKLGRRAADLESDVVYAIINNNANMSDSVALFASGHGNLGTTGAISVTTLGELAELAALATELDGNLINVQLKHFLVPPRKHVLAKQVMGVNFPDAVTNNNPFVNMYNLIVEPRLQSGTTAVASTGSTTAFYMIADPSQVSTIEVAYLEGQQGPMIDEQVDFDSKGLKLSVLHDFGAKALDWRGMYKNAGA